MITIDFRKKRQTISNWYGLELELNKRNNTATLTRGCQFLWEFSGYNDDKENFRFFLTLRIDDFIRWGF